MKIWFIVGFFPNIHLVARFNFDRFLSVQLKVILVYKKTFSVKKYPVCSLLAYQSTQVCLQLDALSLHVSLRWNILIYLPWTVVVCLCQITGMTTLMTYFLCNLLEKRYVIFIISWHCSLGSNFLIDTLRYLSWSALSRSWHLVASGMGLGVMSHQAGLLTTLHHIHICFPEQGGNMATTVGWGF